MSIIKVKNSDIHFVRLGNKESGKTIVFVHGAQGCAEQMQPLAEQLSQYNCVIFDLPSHLRSTGDSIKTIDEFADFMEDFLEKLREAGEITEDLVVIGGSMGGSITIELLVRKVPAIKKAVIISSCAKWDFSEWIDDLLASFKEGKPNLGLLAKPCATSLTPPELVAGMLQFNPQIASCETAYNDFNSIKQFDRVSSLKEIEVPVLIVSGDGDGIAKAHCSHTMRKEIPNSHLLVYPNRGHALCFEKAVEVCAEIKDFLELY